ncbi:hypothetical protein CUMW_194550 [Citrus unshiu]|nr:hypothetical protein CUMW_194550 [Citrus unshiu]
MNCSWTKSNALSSSLVLVNNEETVVHTLLSKSLERGRTVGGAHSRMFCCSHECQSRGFTCK